MAIARDDKCATRSYNCYKVPGLGFPLFETPNISYLEDRYVLGEQLGLGQFGVIRSCSDLVTGEKLACKSISKDHLVSSNNVCGVKLEVELIARLSGHPNVVNLKAVYEDEDTVHLLMELCAGGELFHLIEKHCCFAEHEAAVLFQHLMGVVLYCHDNGIVHRDLKPENILLVSKSASSPIKLADFGLATYIRPGQKLHGVVGSPFYIAPEVLGGGYNEAADVWSAGVILYILLSGMPPFWGKTKSKIFELIRSAELRFPSNPWDQISESAKSLVRGMLERDPTKRLTAKQVLDHPWIKESTDNSQVSCRQCNGVCLDDVAGSCSFSTPLAPQGRDISFNAGCITPYEGQEDSSPPMFTCRSSFSNVRNTPLCTPIGFSFSGSCESDGVVCPSPIISMPSFSFFTPQPYGRGEMPKFSTNALTAHEFDKSCAICHAGISVGGSADLSRAADVNSYRVIGFPSRRNHTIGLGKRAHLDIIVPELVIRWASCTLLPTATSLRSSLVC